MLIIESNSGAIIANPTELTTKIAKRIGDNVILGLTTPAQNPDFLKPIFFKGSSPKTLQNPKKGSVKSSVDNTFSRVNSNCFVICFNCFIEFP